MFVGLMPLVLAAFLVINQPSYLVTLIDNDMGRTILTYGIGAWCAGVVWFQRLTKFDF